MIYREYESGRNCDGGIEYRISLVTTDFRLHKAVICFIENSVETYQENEIEDDER